MSKTTKPQGTEPNPARNTLTVETGRQAFAPLGLRDGDVLTLEEAEVKDIRPGELVSYLLWAISPERCVSRLLGHGTDAVTLEEADGSIHTIHPLLLRRPSRVVSVARQDEARDSAPTDPHEEWPDTIPG